MGSSPNLLIIRTPFQAWLCLQLIDHIELSRYDLVYITHNNSKEDQFYFNRLSINATVYDYVYLPPERFDLFTHVNLRIRMRSWFRYNNYKNIYVASINSFVINALLCRFSASRLYTFDDGAANLLKDGPYSFDPSTGRMKIYRMLFGGVAVEKLREKISQHYSIYKGFGNIVEENRITYLDGCFKGSKEVFDNSSQKNLTKKYFIGAPFKEVMTRQEIEKMIGLMLDVGIDGYIKHPREIKELPIGGKILEKGGRIAEEVILEESAGCAVELYGFLSSVMINLQGFAEKRVVFLSDHHRLSGVGALARESGCREIYLT